MSPSDIAQAADENLVIHAGWLQARLPGMRFIDERGLVIVDSGLPCDTYNFVLRARLRPEAAAGRIREAIRYFNEAGRPFSWWVGPADQPRDLGDLLVAAGLNRDEDELAMAADLAALPEVDLSPGGLRIERVDTTARLRDFANISAANWTPPDPMVLRFYELAEGLLLSKDAPLRLYVGYLDGRPVATSELCLAGGVAGLYNISAAAACRRRGIGTAMTARPMVDAREAGTGAAILQAAPEGVSIYRRVGFEAFGEITEYKPPPVC